MNDNWQSLIMILAVAAAAWWLVRRVIRFARTLRTPGESAACGGCDHCATSPPVQTADGKPIVDLQLDASSAKPAAPGPRC
jgi:hypothetical protein